MHRQYTPEKGYQIVEIWDCDWWSLYEAYASVRNHRGEEILSQRSLTEERLLQETIDGRLLGYVECDVEVPDHLIE